MNKARTGRGSRVLANGRGRERCPLWGHLVQKRARPQTRIRDAVGLLAGRGGVGASANGTRGLRRLDGCRGRAPA